MLFRSILFLPSLLTGAILPIMSPYIFKDGVMIQNDTESVAVKQRIYFPIRVVMEALSAFHICLAVFYCVPPRPDRPCNQ